MCGIASVLCVDDVRCVIASVLCVWSDCALKTGVERNRSSQKPLHPLTLTYNKNDEYTRATQNIPLLKGCMSRTVIKANSLASSSWKSFPLDGDAKPVIFGCDVGFGCCLV